MDDCKLIVLPDLLRSKPNLIPPATSLTSHLPTYAVVRLFMQRVDRYMFSTNIVQVPLGIKPALRDHAHEHVATVA